MKVFGKGIDLGTSLLGKVEKWGPFSSKYFRQIEKWKSWFLVLVALENVSMEPKREDES